MLGARAETGSQGRPPPRPANAKVQPVGIALIATLLAGCGRDPEAQARAEGARLYMALCARCHGATGRGEGRQAAALRLETIIPNFSDPRALSSKPEEAYVDAIQNGRRRAYRGPDLEQTMPAFGSLADDEIRAILSHIRTLPGAGRR